MEAQGWYHDPYGVHEDRYFSAGQPTKLVRDCGIEAYDPPPPHPAPGELAEVPASPSFDGNDLRRAHDPDSGPVLYDNKAAFWAALDSVAVYGPVN